MNADPHDAKIRRMALIGDVVVGVDAKGRAVFDAGKPIADQVAWLRKLGRMKEAAHLESLLPAKG